MAANKMKKVTKLVDGLKECWRDFDMAPTEFIYPSLNSILKFYKRFIEEFGINANTIITLRNEIYQQCQDKECEDILYVYVVYYCSSRLLQQLELTTVDSFKLCFTNIINPIDDKSLIPRTLLLANFLYHVNGSANICHQLKEEILKDINNIDDLIKAEKSINEELKSAVYTIKNNKNKKEGLTTNINLYKTRLNTAQLESEDLDKQIKKLKAELNLYEEENATITESLEINMKEKARLESLIVDDHEAILAEKNKIEQKLSEEEEEISELRKNLELKTEHESNLTNRCVIINNYIDSVNLHKWLDIYDSIEECRNVKEEIIKETHAIERKENEACNLKDQLLINEMKELEENLAELNVKSNIRLQKLHNEVTQLDKEHDEVKSQFEKSTVDVAELSKKLKYATDCCDQYREEIEKQNKYYESLYGRFSDAKSSLDQKVVDVVTLIKETVALVKTKYNSKGN